MSPSPSSSSAQSRIDGPSWIFPEIVSFIVRCSQLMAIGCISEMSNIGALETVLLLLCGVVFFVNCFEFSKPPGEVIFLNTVSALLSAISALMMLSEASLNQKYSTEKYYTTVFESLAASGSVIIMGYFYLFHSSTEKIKEIER